MKRVFLPLLWLMRALSWPVAICLAVGFCLLAILEVCPASMIAFLACLCVFVFLIPFFLLWGFLWGIFRLFQRRFREGLAALFVGVPLAV